MFSGVCGRGCVGNRSTKLKSASTDKSAKSGKTTTSTKTIAGVSDDAMNRLKAAYTMCSNICRDTKRVGRELREAVGHGGGESVSMN